MRTKHLGCNGRKTHITPNEPWVVHGLVAKSERLGGLLNYYYREPEEPLTGKEQSAA